MQCLVVVLLYRLLYSYYDSIERYKNLKFMKNLHLKIFVLVAKNDRK